MRNFTLNTITRERRIRHINEKFAVSRSVRKAEIEQSGELDTRTEQIMLQARAAMGVYSEKRLVYPIKINVRRAQKLF